MEKQRPSFNPNWVLKSCLFTIGCLMIPVCIYSSNTLFTRFCGFHAKFFKLEGRTTGQLFFLAVGVSFFYSTISLNLYYRGLLAIIGLNSIYDIEGIVSEDLVNKYTVDEKKNE